MKSNYKRLGDLISPVSVKNTEMVTDDLRGVNYQKYFMPSVANTVGVDLTGYKVIRKGQFACNLMHVGRDECLPIALHRQEKPIIVSPAYFAFGVKNENEILSEFLFLWFKRAEFDRETCFYTDADVRQGLIKSSFLDIQLPVPPIEEQRKIVAEYQAVERRIENNCRLIATLEATAQTLYRKMFVDNIDPNNLPDGWRMGKLSDVVSYVNLKVNAHEANCYISTENMLKDFGGVTFAEDVSEEIKGTKFTKGDVLLSNIRPYFRKLWLSDRDGCCSNDVLCFRSKSLLFNDLSFYIMCNNQFFDYVMAGANGVKMPRGDKDWIMNYAIPIPNEFSLKQFSDKVKRIKLYRSTLEKENHSINGFKEILLSKLSNI